MPCFIKVVKLMNYDKAYEIASIAHMGQVDKAGKPYLNHVLAVSSKFSKENEKIIALLHDVIEDTAITLSDLRKEGFNELIILAIDSLTRRKGESYTQFIQRVKLNPTAVKIKIEDLLHNMDLSRIPSPSEEDFKRIKKYEKALEQLKL